MGNRRLKLNDDQRRRLAAKATKLGRKRLEQVATIAAPETLLRWHRKLIAQNNAPSACPTPGRPSTDQEISALVVRMAQENRYWGYRRIQGALANLGHDLAHNTIRNILKKHGIEPSAERARKRPGESSFKDIGSRLSSATSLRWLHRREPVWPRWLFSAL